MCRFDLRNMSLDEKKGDFSYQNSEQHLWDPEYLLLNNKPGTVQIKSSRTHSTARL